MGHRKMTKKITVLIADDHPLVRKALKTVIGSLGIAGTILEAGDGKEALEIELKHAIDLYLLDFRMPGMDGYDVAKFVLQKDETKKIIIVSMYTDTPLILNLFRIGVKGFLMKNSDIEEIELAIQRVLSGKTYYNKVFESILGPELSKLGGKKIPPLRFSKREMEVTQLLATGKTSHDIAKKLKLTLKTVETYRSRLLAKVGASNTSELLKYFYQNGLL